MKFPIFKLLLFFLSIMILGSCGKTHRDSKESAADHNESKFKNAGMDDDVKFAINAADGGLLEVRLGELAQNNAFLPEVKDFASMMIADHNLVNSELKELANQKNITLPETLSEESQKIYDDLSVKAGKEFDEAYTEHMIKDHKNDIDLFKKEIEKGVDAEIRSWAAGKVATLERHLERAKQVNQVADNSR